MTVPGIPEIDVHEAAERARDAGPDGPLIVDVREADELARVRIDGALHIPTSAFAERVGELPADRPLLMLCAAGGRSAAATAYLRRQGREDVVNVAGGITAWERAGLPVQRG